MDTRSQVRDFLSTRRARITPDQAGLPAFGGNRRVAGLRREEVVGDLELVHEAFELPADPGLRLSTYTAEPGSASEDALKLLASWATDAPTGPAATAAVQDATA